MNSKTCGCKELFGSSGLSVQTFICSALRATKITASDPRLDVVAGRAVKVKQEWERAKRKRLLLLGWRCPLKAQTGVRFP